MHELAHLWLGTTGVSGAFAEAHIETFCNDVAAGFLLPAHELTLVGDGPRTDVETAARQIGEFSAARHLSRTMVAYGLFRAGSLSDAAWRILGNLFLTQWRQSQDAKRAREKDGAGPSFYVVRRHRLGSALLHFVSRNLADGALTPTRAGQVLGVKPRNVAPLLSTVGPFGG